MTDLPVIEVALSAARLEPYVAAAHGSLAEAIRLYQWNTEISAAFFEALAHFEVGLRNAIHGQLTVLAQREDWWESPAVALAPSAVDILARPKIGVARRADGKAGRVVAALPFGFWVGLLSAGRGLNYETTLWRPALHRAFSNYSGPRSPVHRRLETLRLLRNRIAHHEPVHTRHLAADYQGVLAAAGWMSGGFAEWVRSTSRVGLVLATRP